MVAATPRAQIEIAGAVVDRAHGNLVDHFVGVVLVRTIDTPKPTPVMARFHTFTATAARARSTARAAFTLRPPARSRITCPYVSTHIDGAWPSWPATSITLRCSASSSDANACRRSYGRSVSPAVFAAGWNSRRRQLR